MVLVKEKSRLLLLLLAGALFYCIPLVTTAPSSHETKGVDAPVLSVLIQNSDVDTPSAVDTSEYRALPCKSASSGFKLPPLLFQATPRFSNIPSSFSKQQVSVLRC
jgi:hypothetical protein